MDTASVHEEQTAADELTADALPNFARVSSTLYRGGRPTAAGYAKLRALGVTTVVDLEIDDLIEARQADLDSDRRMATAAGMRWVNVPMQAFTTGLMPSFDAKVNAALRAMRSSTPVYVHCRYGRDRTGMMVGLYRVEVQHWTPERAYQEMLDMGFRRYFLGLKEYFERRTGMFE